MKVVLFCGGEGLRLRDYSDSIPKPLVPIGYRPILWHLMRYYAHHGHKEFILCLGYRANLIKEFFIHYDESLTNDFVLKDGGRNIELLSRDIDDWEITCVDTGLTSNIGQRLKRVERYIGDDEIFLANYADGLTNVPLPRMIEYFRAQDKTACFLGVRPSQNFHVVSIARDGQVRSIRNVAESDVWINGGFFVFKRRIFDYIRDGEELVVEPFQRLIAEEQLISYRHTGFWACMDTFKEKQRFDDMYAQGDAPWEVWKPVDERPRGEG
jgi:glucose-1-phosphate cytidylyltransferase